MDRPRFSPLTHQIFVVSGVLSTIFSCGLGLGFLSTILDQKNVTENLHRIKDQYARSIEIAGEVSFIPAIIIIPFIMQKKGRRLASFTTTLPLLLAWILTYMQKTIINFIIFNILHSIAIGGAVTISSIIVSEFCAPKYRSVFLMLETVVLSLGILLSHLFGSYSCFLKIIPILGTMSVCYAIMNTYFWPESPYWLISQGHIVRCTDNFYWLRGQDEETKKEMDALLVMFKTQMQLQVLKPIIKLNLRERIREYLRMLMKTEFLKPLSIMVLLFSFVGFSGESLITNINFRDIFNVTSGKYVSTIILDVITLVCSLIACVLLRFVKRKSLFIFTGSLAILFFSTAILLVLLQALHMLSQDFMWLLITFGTLFAMFMSLGTTALPFSLLGEIFPLAYKGIGSSLTCAYLWAFGNSILRFAPQLSLSLGAHGVLFVFILFMIAILVILNKIMPETSGKTLGEIQYYINVNTPDHNDENECFDDLKLFIDYV